MVSLEGIPLPSDMRWIDEFTGFGVGQIISPTLTGSLLVEETPQVAGRRITLRSDGAWIEKSVVQSLESLAATPLASGTTLTLIWDDGRLFDVVFDRTRGTGLQATEVKRLRAGAQQASHKYNIQLDLITV